jgi:CheY-like chemotaxis protein
MLIAKFLNAETMSGAKKIYLSDDDADDRSLFKTAFEQVCPEHSLTMFEDNDVLVNNIKLNSGMPDIIFIDLNMPQLNGLECLRILKELPQLKEVPVVIYSTIQIPFFIEEVYELGAAFFIKKPYEFYQLTHLIKYVADMEWDTKIPTPFDEFVVSHNSKKKADVIFTTAFQTNN